MHFGVKVHRGFRVHNGIRFISTSSVYNIYGQIIRLRVLTHEWAGWLLRKPNLKTVNSRDLRLQRTMRFCNITMHTKNECRRIILSHVMNQFQSLDENNYSLLTI